VSRQPSRGARGRAEITVRYAETDSQGVAYHANFFIWMEIGRTRLLHDLGYPYGRLEADGLLFAVAEASCRYSGAARYEERVEIETICREARSRTVVFDYELRVSGRTIATGRTSLVALDRDRRPRRIPESILKALDPGQGFGSDGMIGGGPE
jgi:acyl-CoA thioester hydrolase